MRDDKRVLSNRRGAMLLGVLAGTVAMVVAACGGENATPTPRATATQPAATRPVTAATPTPAPTPTVAPTAAAAPKYGGQLPLRLARGWPIRDTYNAAGGYAQVLTSSMTNTLITTNAYNFQTSEEIIGDLATGWQVSSDGTTFTFKLHQGVQWHDGQRFTSKDVAYSYGRAMTPPDPRVTFLRSKFEVVQKIETPDDLTVVITTKRPSVSFLRGISLNFAQIMPAHVPDMSEWNTKIIGTGPFKLASERQDVEIVVARNSSYFRDGRPYLDSVKFHIIADPAPAAAAFRTGQILANPGTYDSDWVPDQREIIRRDFPTIQSQEYTSSRYDLLLNSIGLLGNPRVRQAISSFIDREEIKIVTYGGLGESLASPMIPASRGGNWGLPQEEMKQWPGFGTAKKAADRARARDLLREAGLTTGVKLRVVSSSHVPHARGAETIVTQLRALGIESDLALLDTTAMADRMLRGDFDLAYNSATLDFDDPAAHLTSFIRTGGGQNFGKWSIAGIDQLLDEADRTFDETARRKVIQTLQREILTELPIMPVVFVGAPNFWREQVKNWPRVYSSLSPAYKFDQVWLDTAVR